MHSIFNYTLESHNSTSVRLHRQYINATASSSTIYKGVDLYLSTPPGSDLSFAVTPVANLTESAPTIDIIVPSSASTQSTLRVRIVTNETSLVGLDTQDLFMAEEDGSTPGIMTALQGLSNGTKEVAQQVGSRIHYQTILARKTLASLDFVPHLFRQIYCRRMALFNSE